jgi:hypothetical protein
LDRIQPEQAAKCVTKAKKKTGDVRVMYCEAGLGRATHGASKTGEFG